MSLDKTFPLGSFHASFHNVSIYMKLPQKLVMIIWKCNLKSKDEIQYFKPGFWRDVLHSWVEFHCINPSAQSEIKSRCIWFNLFMFSQVSVCSRGRSRSLSRGVSVFCPGGGGERSRS